MTYDPNAYRAGYVPATDYAPPHLSRFTIAHDLETHMLAHVNCGLLSTPGVPPTLLALKQHAQSLAYLIAMLEPHGSDEDPVEVLLGRLDSDRARTDKEVEDEKPSKVLKSPLVDLFGFQGLGIKRKKKVTFEEPVKEINDSAGSFSRLIADSREFSEDGSKITPTPFDWLDFTSPYTNDEDPDHHRPLLDLVNEVHSHDDVHGTTYHCPLTTYKPRPAEDEFSDDEDEESGQARPYASHHSLLMHANTCLERLDHECAGTGGLLSLLPAESDDDDELPQMAAARNTLVGQWLIFTQHLVGRLHELEINYTNAVQALSGKALLVGEPGQVESVPQDRWILTNASDSLWSSIHDKLDEAAEAEGVVGERVLDHDGTNHLVHVDIATRFYRADADTRGPIYVSPAPASALVVADQDHIDITTSASTLEQRYDTQLRDAEHMARENTRLTQQLEQRTNLLLLLRSEHTRLQRVNEKLQEAADSAISAGSPRKRVRAKY